MIGFNLGRAEEKEVELARLVEEVKVLCIATSFRKDQ